MKKDSLKERQPQIEPTSNEDNPKERQPLKKDLLKGRQPKRKTASKELLGFCCGKCYQSISGKIVPFLKKEILP